MSNMIISNFRELKTGYNIYRAVVDVEYTKFLGMVKVFETREIACKAYNGKPFHSWRWLETGEYVGNTDHVELLYHAHLEEKGILSE